MKNKSAWKYNFHLHVKKVHELMCILAVILFPMFALFDIKTIPEEKYWYITSIRFLIATIIFIWVFIQKSYGTNEKYLTFFSFCSISFFCCWLNVNAKPEYMYQNNIAFCTVFLAASLFILWKWIFSAIIVSLTAFFYIFLSHIYNVSLHEILFSGGSVLLTIMIIHPIIVHFRYTTIRKNYKFKSYLEDTNEALRKNMLEIEAKNQLLIRTREEYNRANEELQKINQNLEEIVNARTQKLEKTMEELDKFLYSSHHDLKAPIATMRGLVELVRSEKDESKIQEYLNHFDFTLGRIDSLIYRLNEVSYLNNKSVENELVHIKTFFEDLKDKFDYKDLTYWEDIDENIILRSDSRTLQLIFGNLIENSFKYKSETRKCVVRLSVKKHQNDTIRFIIEDNGDGINENILDKIFVMFYRGHPKSNGNGLGLYILKKALEKIHGKVFVESKTGIYTRFVIDIPDDSYEYY